MTTAKRPLGQPSTLDIELAATYAEIVLGMDVLYRQQPRATSDQSLDREGLVPINLTDASPRKYAEWTQVQADLCDLHDQYKTVPDEIRRNYMQQQLSSLIALGRWAAGEPLTFREQVRHFLFVSEDPMTAHEMSRLHEHLDSALAARGYRGTLSEKWARWLAERTIASDQLADVLTDLLVQARQKVAESMFPEIADVNMAPMVVHTVPYSAYCDYVGRTMYVNGDLQYSLPALKHLVCHEAFPGHTTHMYVREQRMRDGSIPADAGLVITDTASSPVFEGIGDNGMAFLEWEDEDDRIYHIFQIVRSAAGANAAHLLHQQGAAPEDVTAYLRQTCFADDAYIASRLRFIQYPLRAPFIYAYWRGYQAVREAYARVVQGDRPRFFEFLYGKMLSADTVRLFV